MQPSRARYRVLAFTTILAIITYLDRVAISTAAPAVRAEMGLDAVQMGWVFSAFTWAYAAFEIPSGWMGDVMGPRKVLTRIVIWWSAFTAATGAAWNFASLLVARFLFGVGEAGAFPNTSRSFAKWFPVAERGAAHGWVFMGTRMGGAITPPIVVALMTAIGWRQTFYVFGVLGVIWAFFWWRWFRDEPSQHPEVNEAELALIRESAGHEPATSHAFRWSELLSANLLLVYGMYFTMGYTLYFNLTWLPTYLKDVRGFSLQQAGWLSGVVLFTGGVMTYVGGKLTDMLVKKYGLKVGRSMGVVTLPIAGLLLIGAAQTQSPMAAAILLAATLGVADLAVSSCWAICHDIGGRNAGIVTGAMNTWGNIGGALSPLVVGYAVGWWNSWTVPFYITAGIYVFGAVCTFFVDPRKRVNLAS
ncbi:MAG TPA: MFS transporter [Vicinamibacterales bacterium]|nr:MFS transporter [Vicinamibacterales bacterium]